MLSFFTVTSKHEVVRQLWSQYSNDDKNACLQNCWLDLHALKTKNQIYANVISERLFFSAIKKHGKHITYCRLMNYHVELFFFKLFCLDDYLQVYGSILNKLWLGLGLEEINN